MVFQNFSIELFDYMELEYLHLAEGTTISGEYCPACDGGNKRLRTMSVSRKDKKLLWLCHRNSCGFRGGSKSYTGVLSDKDKIEEERNIVYPTIYSLSDSDYKDLETKYGIDRITAKRSEISITKKSYILGWGDESYYYFPVWDSKDEQQGYHAKALLKDCIPKAKTKTRYESSMAWYVNRTKTTKVVVVEDCLSAVRVSARLTGVALLGTHVNDIKIEALMEFNPEVIYLALDADAFVRAVRYVIEYKGAAKGKLKLVKLTQDIKNMAPEKFEEFIKGL